MLSRSFGVPSRREGPPNIWDTHGISGNVFANPDASSSVLYPQLNQWSSSIEEPLHSFAVDEGERQKQDRDLRCQSGPSAKDSVIFSGGDSTKNCGKIRFKIEVCICSHFSYGSYATDQRSGDGGSSGWFGIFVTTRAISMPNFEVLDARIASALNKIIHNSHFTRRISLEEQRPRSRTSFAVGRLFI